MATADHMTQAGAVRDDPTHRTWFIAAVIILLVVALVFAGLWLVERDSVAALEGDLNSAEASVQGLEQELATAQADVAGLEAEVAALESSNPVPHEAQAAVQGLYDRFVVALENPNAAAIAAMFTPNAVHIDALGVETIGAEAIGAGWVDYGPMTVEDPGELIVHGNANGSLVAAMTGSVSGVEGLLVTRIAMWDGDPNFSHMIWFKR